MCMANATDTCPCSSFSDNPRACARDEGSCLLGKPAQHSADGYPVPRIARWIAVVAPRSRDGTAWA